MNFVTSACLAGRASPYGRAMRIPTIVLLAAAMLAAAAAPAFATVTPVLDSGTLTVTSNDASDTVALTCAGAT